jgi:hypothetical protein
MDKSRYLTEGELLLLLVRRSEIDAKNIAEKLNIHPGHLSKMFKSERLTNKMKRAICKLFELPDTFFDDTDGSSIPVFTVNEKQQEYGIEIEDMTAGEALRYLEEKDRRHYEERGRRLAIIENLTKK